MTKPSRVLAVDLGAASVRVAAVDLAADAPEVEIVHRWRHSPVTAGDGSLRWDWSRLVAEVEFGLGKGLQAGPVASIGIDGWGVDYGLIDHQGGLVEWPFSYRDTRTESWGQIADAIGRDRLYEVTGIQLMPFNTIFQLAVHDPQKLEQAQNVLLLPDLLVHQLTGTVVAERSNASTTALLDAQTGDWSTALLDEIGVDPGLLPTVVGAGKRTGGWNGIPIHLVGSHDTASAFLGMPGAEADTVFVSTGTWVIVGIERDTPDTSPAARLANFSNEAGALGGFRFLKNVVGFWILEQCRSAWGDPPIEDLLTEASTVDMAVPTFDAGDHRFVNPVDMEKEVRDASALGERTPREVVVRTIVESIVAGVGRVIEEIGTITDTPPSRIALVGGGARVPFLHQLLAEKTGLRVVVGSPEATALGNAIVQGLSVGHFADLTEARSWLESSAMPS